MKKIIIHDYAGHPFQLELSKELSKKFKIYHIYFKNDYGPKGDFNKTLEENLIVEGIGENINYNKGNFFTRFVKDIIYGKLLEKKIRQIKPDIVISGNCPILSQEIILKSCKLNKSKFFFWVQDFYSIAAKKILFEKFYLFSLPITLIFDFIEKRQFKSSNKIIIISEDFKEELNKWKINSKNIFTIPNWGNLNEINFNIIKKKNFLIKNNIDINKFNIFYTGTLALKHNPEIILKIAEENKNIQIIIFGIGSGFDKLKSNKNLNKNIILFPLQPFNMLNDLLNSADLFLCILNKDAGKYSVPSKILNYLCAGRPIIMCGPQTNLASKIIKNSNSGIIYESGDLKEINKFINKIQTNIDYKNKLSNNARKYAEQNFDIKKISLSFENIINNELKK